MCSKFKEYAKCSQNISYDHYVGQMAVCQVDKVWKPAFQVEGTAKAKAQRLETAWFLLGTQGR